MFGQYVLAQGTVELFPESGSESRLVVSTPKVVMGLFAASQGTAEATDMNSAMRTAIFEKKAQQTVASRKMTLPLVKKTGQNVR